MTAKTEPQTEADAIAAIARRGVDPQIVTIPDGRAILVVPRDRAVVDITDRNASPPALPGTVHQAVTLQASESLIAYVNRFKQPSTVLLSDIAANKIVGIIDYHGEAGAAPDDSDDLIGVNAIPARLAHQASLTLLFSEEWKTWTAVDDRLMGQLEFARFLEENACDVLAPSGAELLEVCRDLQAVRKVDFRKAVRTASDNESFEYSDSTEARVGAGAVEVPTQFQLQIPVYFEGRTTHVTAFLRWRLVEGDGLKLGVKLSRAEYVRQAMFREIVDQIAVSTQAPAMYGKVEPPKPVAALDAVVISAGTSS